MIEPTFIIPSRHANVVVPNTKSGVNESITLKLLLSKEWGNTSVVSIYFGPIKKPFGEVFFVKSNQ
jgi:hypothetical protein